MLKTINFPLENMSSQNKKEDKKEDKKEEGELAPYFFNLSRVDKHELILQANNRFLAIHQKNDGFMSALTVKFLHGLISHQSESVGTEFEIKSFAELMSWCDYDRIYAHYKKQLFSHNTNDYFTQALYLNFEFVSVGGNLTPEQKETNDNTKIKLENHQKMGRLVMKNAIFRIQTLEQILTPQREKYFMDLKLKRVEPNMNMNLNNLMILNKI